MNDALTTCEVLRLLYKITCATAAQEIGHLISFWGDLHITLYMRLRH
jgi:hypothetical protein